jgi:hypothetical protein
VHRAVVLALVAAPLAAVGAAPSLSAPAPASITIAAQPPDLLRDRRLTLFGSIPSTRPKQVVVLEARDCGQSLYHQVARVETSVGGRWSWPYYYPGITARVRARWNGATSAPVRVRDRAFVELRQTSARVFSVSVRAKMSFERKRVLLQRLDPARGWNTIATARLTESAVPPGVSYVYTRGRLTAATAPRRSLVRAVFPAAEARPCYLAGRSNMLRLP